MKTYVITIAKTFPKTHPKAGELTRFKQAIESQSKLHTIRLDYELWEKRFKKIDAGLACLSVREWTDRPYKSPQIELFNFITTDGIGLQKMEQKNVALFLINNNNVELSELANRDGLTLRDFINWFKLPLEEPGAIIHFTKFRY